VQVYHSEKKGNFLAYHEQGKRGNSWSESEMLE